jgi:hypothetical protein
MNPLFKFVARFSVLCILVSFGWSRLDAQGSSGFSTQPSPESGVPGGAASFTFAVYLPSAGAPITIAVYQNGTNDSARFSITSETINSYVSFGSIYTVGTYVLGIANLTPSDAGSYTFEVVVGGSSPSDSTSNPVVLTVATLSTQTITFTPISGVAIGVPVSLNAYSSSGLPVSFAVQSGNATITGGSTMTVFDTNPVTIVASCPGNGTYSAAPNVTQTVTAVSSGNIPAIITQPASQMTNAGASVTLSVVASGATSYQWQLNGSSISGATNSTLTLANIGTPQAGSYTVVVTDTYGSKTSSPATLTTNVSSYLYNISSRAYYGSGPYQNIVAGFYTNGSGSKNVVVGGIGPSLAVVSPALSGLILASPKLTLFNGGGATLATNTAWGDSQTLINALASVYATPLQPDSNDTAIFTSVPAGPGIGYTAEVDGLNNDTGIALVEVYDYDSYTGTPASRLINISTRAFVGTGDDVLVAGFWTIGSTSQTILIRAVGPGLAASDSALSGLTLVTPTLSLYDSSGNIIATNTGWGNAPVAGNSTVAVGLQPATAAIMNGVYATPISAGSADCAMVVTLPANAGYTAQVTGVGSTTGIALVEVYDVP